MTATQLLVWGGLIHLIVDWVLQNAWMAENKAITGATTHSRFHAGDVVAGVRLRRLADDEDYLVDIAGEQDVYLVRAGRLAPTHFTMEEVLRDFRKRGPKPEGPWHLASYAHAGLHALALCLIFPSWVAFVVGWIHWCVDLRVTLVWWRRVYGQTTEGPLATHVAIWEDQAVHLAVIGWAAFWCGRGL